MKNGKCPEGKYYCYTDKVCKDIPAGFMVDPQGMLRKENGASASEANKSGDSSLRDWFAKSKSSDGKPGWVQLGGKYSGKPCAKQPGQTTKPKCGSSKMKRSLSKDDEQRAFLRKNRQDPNPERSGKAINVKTEAKIFEGEKDACYHKVKSRYKVWPSAYASGALVKCRKVGADSWGNKTKNEGFTPAQIAALESIGAIEINEAGKKCWKGYKKVGTQKLFGKTYNRCEKEGYSHENSSGQTDLSHVSEAVTVPRQNGQVMNVMLVFRGKFYMMQLFFPTLQLPTKQEVTAAVQKIYPDSRVTQYYKSTVDPTQPLIRISEQQDESQEKQAQQLARRQLMLNRQKLQLQAKAVQKKQQTDMVVQTEEIKGKCSHTPKGKKCAVHGENECPDEDDLDEAVGAWQRKEGKNQSGGLNEKGRKSYERQNPGSDLKAPSKKVGNPRRASFCARMSGMKKKLTSSKTANDPNSRINKSLRAWNC